ncbi:hypothetical protein ASPBRDRAFT_46140 [Aspergillus brasiliensis CBS 101740]|uniref:N-acetyltransferase domain-containing protein n=1 Tax=Aspergillus brasiliensis (strain CBS 101740 / IMI 381727 / IBT 21946) TaxID=767769 RepID=A0A1L9UAX8_ASPBC|nr:hypothetical protein ASPBRDRAFT_46140 [Aspergillus brasiliensis CBS 101740]
MLQTLPCTPSDAHALVTLYLQCFNTPTDQRLWPNTPEIHALWVASFTRKLTEGVNKYHILKVIDTENNNELAGFLEWILPAPPVNDNEKKDKEEEGKDDEFEELVATYPSNVGDLDFLKEVLEQMKTVTGGIMGERRFYFLNIICTHPEYRRRGVASEMIKWGTDRADEEGLETFVISAPMARPVYQKHGFELVREGEAFGDFVPWYMVRKPKIIRTKQESGAGYAKWLLGVSAVLGVGVILYQRYRRAL